MFYQFSLSLTHLGDPPIKAIEFDGYMVLKNTLNGDKIPICRVEDLEITLVSPDLPVKVRLSAESEHQWRSLSEVRAAEIQCMQLALALLARHESEMYVTMGTEKDTKNYSRSSSNQEQRIHKSHQVSDARKKHLEECERVFGNNTNTKIDNDMYSYESTEKQFNTLTLSGRNMNSSSRSKEESNRTTKHSSHSASDKLYRTSTYNEDEDSYNRSHRPVRKLNSTAPSSISSRTKTNTN